MTEKWKPVVGFEGLYEVSDLGRVRSLDRIITRTVRWKSGIVKEIAYRHIGQMLRPGLASNGYLTVAIKTVSHCVQILVLTAFAGPAPEGLECCHGDGDRQNNRLTNLRWDTHASNVADMAKHGTKLIGSAYSTAKLNDETARRVRALRGVHPQSELARMFNVSPSAIQAVHDGRTWKHV